MAESSSGSPEALLARRRSAFLRGEAAERWVAAKLEQQGARVLAHRWQGGGGEIDIIAIHGGALRFIEVKARTDTDTLDPALAVTPSKQRKLTAAAHAWLDAHAVDYDEIAFLVAIVDTSMQPWSVVWIDDAFDASGLG